MKKNKKIMLDDLVARKTQGELDKLQVKIFESEELGGSIELHKIPLKKFFALTGEVEDSDSSESLEYMGKVILECWPLIKNNAGELVKTYEVGEATDLPAAILNDNVGEMQKILEDINGFYGLGEVQEAIKN